MHTCSEVRRPRPGAGWALPGRPGRHLAGGGLVRVGGRRPGVALVSPWCRPGDARDLDRVTHLVLVGIGDEPGLAGPARVVRAQDHLRVRERRLPYRPGPVSPRSRASPPGDNPGRDKDAGRQYRGYENYRSAQPRVPSITFHKYLPPPSRHSVRPARRRDARSPKHTTPAFPGGIFLVTKRLRRGSSDGCGAGLRR